MTAEEYDLVRWYVMRAHKAEAKAEEKLSGAGIEYYIPKAWVVRVYHGRKTKRLVPVIPGIIFVRASHRTIVDFKIANNYLQFVIWNRRDGQEYLIVPDRQMEDFIKISSDPNADALYLAPEEVNIKKGAKVRIIGGDLDGVCGVFMKVKGKRNRRLVVLLDGVTAVAAEIQPDLIEVIE